jgi:hypothetical protein
MVVKYVLATLGFLLALPMLFLVAMALGPVALGILCAVGFGLIVFLIWNALLALGLLGRSAWRHAHHAGG